MLILFIQSLERHGCICRQLEDPRSLLSVLPPIPCSGSQSVSRGCLPLPEENSRYFWPPGIQLSSYTCSNLMKQGPGFDALNLTSVVPEKQPIDISTIWKQVKCLSISQNPRKSCVTQHLQKSSHWCANAGGGGMQSWVTFFQQLFRIRHFLHFVMTGF